MAGARRLQGILPPLVTPFTRDGALDLRAFESNLAAYAEIGLGGLLVLGSNGEAPALEEAEKLELIRAARRAAPERTLLAGTGAESTAATIRLTRAAADCGADFALVLPPHYYRSRMSEDALRRHFESVADKAPVPILLYAVPVVTGLVFSAELVAGLSRHPNVAGIKESSGDIALLGRIVADAPPEFAVLCGSGPVLYPALCSGAKGAVLAVACCAPRATVAVYDAWRAGDHARALRLQQAIAPLAAAVTAGHGVAGLKAAMELGGFCGGFVRAPLLGVAPAVRQQLAGLLERLRAAEQELSPAGSG